jgi:hypothetical protein
MHRIYKIGILHELVTKNPVQHVVTSDIVSRLRCQPISRPLSRIPILSNRRRRVDGAGEWIGYSPCVGRSGIPTVEEPNKTAIENARQRRPGGLRFLSPRPPLRDFTKEMDLILTGRPG